MLAHVVRFLKFSLGNNYRCTRKCKDTPMVGLCVHLPISPAASPCLTMGQYRYQEANSGTTCSVSTTTQAFVCVCVCQCVHSSKPSITCAASFMSTIIIKMRATSSGSCFLAVLSLF